MEDRERTGSWHCLELLEEFEWFVFPAAEQGETAPHEAPERPPMGVPPGEGYGSGVASMEDLMRLLEREAGKG